MYLTKNYFGEIVPTGLAIHPFSSNDSPKGKSFARFSSVTDADGVHFAIPHNRVNTRHFALSNRLDICYRQSLLADGLLQRFGCAAGGIQLVNMMYLCHVRCVIGVCYHEFCQLAVEGKEDIHAYTIVG